jgi:tRNA dimethylallyltransferase
MPDAEQPCHLYLLLGGTAVGKSAAAIPLAERLGAEILSVDSMQVYRRMDIGTAKPSVDDRRRVRHHLIDVVEPSEAFSVARFVAAADAAIADAAARGRAILAVAGTPLYLMALLYGLFDGPSADPAIRERIRSRAAREGADALHAELAAVDPLAAERIHPNDLRRIERALEVFETTGRPISQQQRQWSGPPRYAYRAVGLRRTREDQSRRINARVRQMIAAGLVDEVRALLAEPAGLSEQAAAAVGYAEMIRHIRGELTLEDAIEAIKINTRRLAKSQRTWFRRVPGVQWLDLVADRHETTLIDALSTRLGL